MIRIRVDDFPQTKGEPQHTLAAFRDFHRELTACTGVRYLLGVIPGRSSVEDVLFLRNETDCVIGMHGIDHDETKLDLYRNEFPPHFTQKEITRRLSEARSALENAVGREVDIYMPPRNLIDSATITALHSCGFVGFTGGPETTEGFRNDRNGLYFHSEPPHEYGRTDEMFARESHNVLKAVCEQGRDVILTLHWTWETNIGLSHMRKFLTAIPKGFYCDF